jgi:chromosome segregation ATPase
VLTLNAQQAGQYVVQKRSLSCSTAVFRAQDHLEEIITELKNELGGKIDGLSERMVRVELRLESIDRRVGSLERRFDEFLEEIDDIKAKLKTLTRRSELVIVERRVVALERKVGIRGRR